MCLQNLISASINNPYLGSNVLKLVAGRQKMQSETSVSKSRVMRPKLQHIIASMQTAGEEGTWTELVAIRGNLRKDCSYHQIRGINFKEFF